MHSGELGKMEEKDEKNLQDYFYDTHDKMFKKKGQPYGPGKTNLYPTDYGILYCILLNGSILSCKTTKIY